jgi:replication factor C subunit 3/5|eukprot:CAMPEP_0174291438 /NCGR_PEP_ID=MMETSP0809-20121228/32053_1 /TAXON_ID=73025 ORGANISM="Eutreptiella gymnastica-like, Strain CCMP1594" /NCGR_SAMPLE_ID=MMETSP0809 /ASSEMBLY_ACC=CAM_ASM_000658 /LENGTH=347 /DNA_ID=CAMNT_0015390749 /DNA_START=36 /DNA_END=1079 /DNA_ORIENTATION=+
MLWTDKYRPKDLDQMDVHKEICERLKKVVSEGDFPHLLFYGPSGGGKKTRIMALLRHYFGPGVEKLKSEHKTYKVNDKAIEVSTLSSQYHIEVTPSEAGTSDRIVIMTMIKEIAESAPLDSSGQKSFKVIILNEVDELTRGAQQALRRTMEKYMRTCRLILTANTTSQIIDPLRSRCLGIRIPLPRADEVVGVLNFVAKKEGLQLPLPFAEAIADSSEGNLRRAILSLESCKVAQYPFTANQTVTPPDWEMFTTSIADAMCIEQSPKQILEVRGFLYELLANCIPPTLIIRMLSKELMKNVDTDMKCAVAHWAAHYEHQIKLGSKPILHLEAFVCKFMHIYKKAAAL